MSEIIDVDEDNLKHGLLGLVMALVEIIRDALRLQALERMESGRLGEEEINKLGQALMDMEVSIKQIEEEQGITEFVKAVRDGLNRIADEVIDKTINPERWREEVK